MQTTDENWISFCVYFMCTIGVVLVMLSSYFLGSRKASLLRVVPYESGMLGTKQSHAPFLSTFYLIAMLFVVFDVETIFLVCWSVVVRQLGLFGLIQASIFILSLFVTLFYLNKMHVFNLSYPAASEDKL